MSLTRESTENSMIDILYDTPNVNRILYYDGKTIENLENVKIYQQDLIL